MSITIDEAKRIASLIRPKFDQYLGKYSFSKYPAENYVRYKATYSKMTLPNTEIRESLVWKWGHFGKDNFPHQQKMLMEKIEALWPKYVASNTRSTAKDTFTWWREHLGRTSYITAAYITHLVHHADPLPIIDQHNFRAMNHFLKLVRPSHKANATPNSWKDISELKNFMVSILEHLPSRSFGELDRYLMMYGKSVKPRKSTKPK